MVIIPREKPVVENLNSYYVNLQRLLEHFQGEVGSGAIYLKSPSAEGVIFFDKDEVLEGLYENKQEKLSGVKAVDRLLTSSADDNYTVGIYEIDPDQIYFWTSIPDAKRTYEDLSTEFTNLEGLIKKMSSEKLSGYIEVSLESKGESGVIFFRNGQVIGGSYSWEEGGLSRSKKAQDLLVQKAKESGGTLNVSKISLKGSGGLDKPKQKVPSVITKCLEDLLGLFEDLVRSNKSIKGDFNTLLKRKFLDMAEKYAFLDPFAGEFEYSNRKVRFSGDSTDRELAEGLLSSVKELARETGMEHKIQGVLDTWFQKHEKKLSSLGIRA